MKYQYEVLFEEIMARRNRDVIAESALIVSAHDKVVIDPEYLRDNKDDLIRAKGYAYLEQLKMLADSKKILTVSAIKRTNRPTSNAVDGQSSTGQDEVDVVDSYNPGNFHSPMTVPMAILRKVTDYNGSFNIPLDDSTAYKQNTSSETRDDYNSGKQPSGTRFK